MARIGDLDVTPLDLGGNVFGWTADEQQSFAVLDAFVEQGGDLIDTADVYSAWVDGNSGGESEAIIGRWMAARGNRDQLVVSTKVSKHPALTGLSAPTIRTAVQESLRRLQTDRIDLYYAHADDPDTPLEETLEAFDGLVRDGQVRVLGASNYSADRLQQALEVSDREGFARYAALQPEYNLVSRADYEGALQELAVREGLAVLPYYGLASGFLTGKYQPGSDPQSARSGSVQEYLGDDTAQSALGELLAVADETGAEPASVALAWLRAQDGVVAPIASARTVEQVPALMASAHLELSGEQVRRLTEAGA